MPFPLDVRARFGANPAPNFKHRGFIMLTGKLRSQIDTLWDAFWSGALQHDAFRRELYHDAPDL